VSLTTSQIPQHNHLLNTLSGSQGNQASPSSSYYMADEGGGTGGENGPAYVTGGTGTQQTMAPISVSIAGGSIPHNNIQPVLAVTYCIAMFGIYPPQS
jgi:microcystin-dependent protein